MLIDGKKIAEEIKDEIKQQIESVSASVKRPPCLAVILVGENPASQLYVKRKREACALAGIRSILFELPSSISMEELQNKVKELNLSEEVDGILIQLPLPEQINTLAIMQMISPEKDIDGFHPINVGKLLIGDVTGFCPCTPLGIKRMLEYHQVELKGKHAVIVGRSNIVGKPMAALLLQNSSLGSPTVTIANSQTQPLGEITRQADLLITAVGHPCLIQEDMVKEGAVVIDVGINKILDQVSGRPKIVGDVDFERVKNKSRLITPVPGGVGPMTIAMLLSNTLKSYLNRVTKTG